MSLAGVWGQRPQTFSLTSLHLFDVFFQTPVVVGHHLRCLYTDVAEMLGLCEEPGQLLLVLGEADDEAVFVAVLVQPFLLLGSGEGYAWYSDVKGEAGHVLAGAGGRYRLICGREAASYKKYRYRIRNIR